MLSPSAIAALCDEAMKLGATKKELDNIRRSLDGTLQLRVAVAVRGRLVSALGEYAPPNCAITALEAAHVIGKVDLTPTIDRLTR